MHLVKCALSYYFFAQYLQHMLDLSKMRERAEEPNEFRNNLHLVGFEYTRNNNRLI